MATRLPHSVPLHGRTFSTAMWVLGLCLFLQVLAVAVAVLRRPTSLPSTPVTVGTVFPAANAALPAPIRPAAPPQTMASNGFVPPLTAGVGTLPLEMPLLSAPALSSSAKEAEAAAVTAFLDIPVPTTTTPSPAPPPSPRVAASLAPPSPGETHPAHQLGTPQLESIMAEALELRSTGDTVQALERLRALEVSLPEHPRVLQELAVTLNQMGLTSKASSYWNRIEALGPEKAGAFYDLATMALKGDPLAGDTMKPKTLKLGKIGAHQSQDAAEGEEIWSLSVPVLALDGATPKGEDMIIKVQFFDELEGGAVEKSTATVEEEFISQPYDWKDEAREVINVIYHQKAFTPEEIKDGGRRKYYGYAIEMYYCDILQDTVADPATLLEEMERPSAKKPPVQGPDSSLFPNE
ncbi:MAG: hypothetical protein R3F31_08970 [Verrucomicrobiales bacterium]